MPNWCENRILFVGRDEDASLLYDKAFEPDGDFKLLERFIPTPPELLDEALDDPTLPSWYAWRVDNWGCKWDVSSPVLTSHEKFTNKDGVAYSSYEMSFETPWAPPLAGLKTISKLFPNIVIVIEYSEPGMGFCGYAKYLNGEELEAVESDIVPELDDYSDYVQVNYFLDTEGEMSENV